MRTQENHSSRASSGSGSAARRGPQRAQEGRSFARGTIGEEVKGLLGHPDLSYSDIAAVVHNRHPDAATSPKSVASMAKTFRAKGEKVPERDSGLGRPRLH